MVLVMPPRVRFSPNSLVNKRLRWRMNLHCKFKVPSPMWEILETFVPNHGIKKLCLS